MPISGVLQYNPSARLRNTIQFHPIIFLLHVIMSQFTYKSKPPLASAPRAAGEINLCRSSATVLAADPIDPAPSPSLSSSRSGLPPRGRRHLGGSPPLGPPPPPHPTSLPSDLSLSFFFSIPVPVPPTKFLGTNTTANPSRLAR